MRWFIAAIKKYAVFSGRAGRPEFWYFTLIYSLIALALTALDVLLALYAPVAGLGVVSGIYSLALLLPALAVTVRRLHDAGHTGWWLLITAVPLVGLVVMLFLTVKPGTPGANAYGPPPELDG